MFEFGKRIAAILPGAMQQELHRWSCMAKIRTGRFVHDEPEYKRLSEWVSAGDSVMDIGANVGVFSARLSQLVGSTGHVFAFEPVPQTFGLLSSNAKLFAHPNITLLNVAASNQTGTVEMDIPQFSNGLTAFTRAGISESYDSSKGEAKTRVAAYSLVIDSLEIPQPISFVKIDVEGHEYNVLLGMKKTLERDGPTLVVEGDEKEVIELLTGMGYTHSKSADSPNSVFIKNPT